MKKNKKPQLAPPFAAETKDVRFAGTFEVLVPVPERNKPAKVPLQFATLAAAKSWRESSIVSRDCPARVPPWNAARRASS